MSVTVTVHPELDLATDTTLRAGCQAGRSGSSSLFGAVGVLLVVGPILLVVRF